MISSVGFLLKQYTLDQFKQDLNRAISNFNSIGFGTGKFWEEWINWFGQFFNKDLKLAECVCVILNNKKCIYADIELNSIFIKYSNVNYGDIESECMENFNNIYD